MPDIFISYSSQDAEHAQLLTELLTSAGLSVWIDQSGIDVATSWSASIVDAINECKAFIVLLSQSSIDSHNVIKEVSLASEKRKKILPLDLEPVTLPRELEYQLAGIQRAPMTNIDAIIRALAKLGLEATGAPQAPRIVKESDGKKSLMILPFEDLSPAGDNAWFAEGIVSELIAALGTVKALKLADTQATKEFRSFRRSLAAYASESSIRYFVQGEVRKFGDQLKINARLLDIQTGDMLWQDSLKGTMQQVFELQEQVAQKVLEGLQLYLTNEEKKKLSQRGTTNTEAYELSLRSNQYFGKQTKADWQVALKMISDALALDPEYAEAMLAKAGILASIYSRYGAKKETLSEAEALATKALAIKPEIWWGYNALAQVHFLQGKFEQAEQDVLFYVQHDPKNYHAYFSLGRLYAEAGKDERSIEPYEMCLSLRSDQIVCYTNLVLAAKRIGDTARVRKWSQAALPYFEKHLRLVPDDYNAYVSYVHQLECAGHHERAVQALAEIEGKGGLDGLVLYNIACLHSQWHEADRAIAFLRKAFEAGSRIIDLMRSDADLDPIRALPEFQALTAELQAHECI